MKRIAIEEHCYTKEYLSYMYSRKECPRWEIVEDEKHRKIDRWWRAPSLPPIDFGPDGTRITDKLTDLGEGRLREMDKAGIDMAVLSLGNPGVDGFEAADGTIWAKKTNDQLAEVVKRYPKRFAALATLALADPQGAANELKRAVTELGLKGALTFSHVHGEYLDDRKYWIVLETAEKLGVPIYIHPTFPSPDMLKPYSGYSGLSTSAWGFAAEAGLHAVRLILSGVFDEYPGLTIILGHLGEALPFWMWRMDNRLNRLSSLKKKHKRKPSDYIKDNFLVTTSGMFWEPPFLCTYLGLGADNILFAVDYPHESNEVAVQFMDSVSICDGDKEKIYHLNVEKLLVL